MKRIVFWQGIVSPHMYSLAKSCAKTGFKTAYIAEKEISVHRQAMGWNVEQTNQVETVIFEKPERIPLLVKEHRDAIHIVQGVCANGVMEEVRRCLWQNRARWGGVLETIDERSRLKAPLKRWLYRKRLTSPEKRPDFVLATGMKTPQWIAERGYPREHIFPFAYFLPMSDEVKNFPRQTGSFRIGYVGRFIQLKRIDLLIDALAGVNSPGFELVWIGDGPLHDELKKRAIRCIGQERLKSHGTLSIQQVGHVMSTLDCLVLPSSHDGWGAVIVEAMMHGVPVVCSDACGASLAVRASGVGEVFPRGNADVLKLALEKMIQRGPLPEEKRRNLAKRARCFSAEAGARYLQEIIQHVYAEGPLPVPPWE